MKITIIAGARPNFMKIAPLIHEIKRRNHPQLQYRLIHTGQHYDPKLSQTFFESLNIPAPDVNLEVGSGSQAAQTGQIMLKFEEELQQHPADVVLVVGDVNSTLACSIVAKKMNTQLVHVEAGIRSWDMTMPEEINRMVTDALADHFFTTSDYANENLQKSGVENGRIHWVGNTMIDTLLANKDRFACSPELEALQLKDKSYWVLTLHRPSNVDDEKVLEGILQDIQTHSGSAKIIFPVHPRTAARLDKIGRDKFKNLILIDPQGYLEFMYLIKHALGVITDSGGIQEETTVLGVPCLTLRKNTERPETIAVGTNVLVPDLKDLGSHMQKVQTGGWKKGEIPPYWDGKTSERIIQKLMDLYL